VTQPRGCSCSGAWLWIVPLAVLLAGTVADLAFHLDLAVSRLFYDSHASTPWLFGDSPFARHLEDSVWIPDAALAVVAGILCLRGARRRQRWLVRAGLTLLVSLLVGPVLLANIVLKPHFGRPRPQEVVEFGGAERFHPVLEPSPSGDSFPSGHAAAAFAVMLPFLALRRTHPRLACGALIGGLLYGCLIGFLRIGHGRHFFTDVLWAWGLVWFIGYGFSAFFGWLLPDRPSPAGPGTSPVG
jgi:lipid A 4'-phosphatase